MGDVGREGAHARRRAALFCQWRTNVSLVFSIRRMLLQSSAAAPSNETRIAQAPVAERPIALPPRNQGADALCHCYSNHCYSNQLLFQPPPPCVKCGTATVVAPAFNEAQRDFVVRC